MKFDVVDGTISFAQGRLGPELDRQQFLETPLGRAAEGRLVNQQWRHYGIDPEASVVGTVIFNGDVIERIYLAMKVESEESEAWSVERELERKKRHDRWLREELGEPPYSYAWGRIVSAFDPKGLASEIIVVYER